MVKGDLKTHLRSGGAVPEDSEVVAGCSGDDEEVPDEVVVTKAMSGEEGESA